VTADKTKAVIIDIGSYQKTIDAINLAKLLSFGEKEIKNGNLISHEDAKKHLKKLCLEEVNEKY